MQLSNLKNQDGNLYSKFCLSYQAMFPLLFKFKKCNKKYDKVMFLSQCPSNDPGSDMESHCVPLHS